MRASLLLLGLWLSACNGKFTVPPEPGEMEGVRPRCGEIGEPLAVSPVTANVGAGQLLVLRGSGGTGVYRWSLAENVSGGDVDPNAGVYVAGTPLGDAEATVDVVLLEDRGCRGEATASLTVEDAPRVLPSRVEVERGETLTFVGEGGSGRYAFSLATDATGGSIDATGRYTAGARTGTDVVRLTDEELGATADAVVDVVADASLVLAPPEWAVPIGSTVTLPIEGGSGEYDLRIEGSGVVQVAGATLRMESAGEAMVTFTDRFTSRTVSARVVSLAAHEASRRHPGDRSERHQVGGAADIDGDGFRDVVLAMPDLGRDWTDSGAVLIFRGTATGLEATPARVLSGSYRDEEYGTSASLADLDGDGRLDLLVGARRADPIRRDVGALYVYAGVEGALFAETPTRAFFGQNSFDLFGSAHVTCDFNGDGVLDLAVGAPFGQDADGARDQGVIGVYLGYSGGRFVSSPDVNVVGQILVDGEWVGHESMRLGESLAAGDYDGDGLCDLAAYASSPGPDQQDSGAVLLFRGRAPDDTGRGGPARQPSLFWALADGSDDNARFGEDLAMGDVDGDGLADLLASRYLHDGAEGNDSGAIYLRRGRALSGPATAITGVEAGADWSREGGGSDRMGNAALLYDVDGDGRADVVSGDSRATPEESELSRPGVVRVYRGAGGPSATPDREHVGPVNDSRFGAGLGAVGDLDGDGQSELIAFAPYYDPVEGENDDRGAVFLLPSRGAPVELQVERPSRGQRVGQSVAWLGDLDGDGFPELAVGASLADITGVGRDVGAVHVYRGTASGVDPTPIQTLSGFAGHSEGDHFGEVVRLAGDFDGDGQADLAVVSRQDDLPSSFDDAVYDAGGGCGEARSNSGAVYVFAGVGDGTFEPEPAFVYYGPDAGQFVDDLVGELDVDGDGRPDLVAGGPFWDFGGNDRGGVEIIAGRPRAMDGRVLVICAGDRVTGDQNDAHYGTAVARLGDLDGDGCDDFAVGAPEADPGDVRNAGEVVLQLGWGPTCASTTPRAARLRGNDRDSQAGRHLGGGIDLTGDGSVDLLVGASNFRDGRGEVGRVYLVNGAYALSRLGGAGPIIDAGSAATLAVDGSSPGERFGFSLAVTTLPGGGAAAVVGGIYGGASGVIDTGGVAVYETNAMGFARQPRLRVSGESAGESLLGYSVSARRAGPRAFLAVGAPFGSTAATDDGASYALVLQ